RETMPRPLRPYGVMKLNQENALVQLAGEAGFKVRIYRPSTVYGTREFGFRTGLVSHLFWNALRNTPTTLEANFHALRDYVHAGDVAAYIANRVAPFEADDQEVHFLVSGKPSSIFEIAGLVERMLGRTLVLRYSDRTQNDRDITFRSEVMPPSWRPHDLETGLRAVYRNTSFLYLRDVPFDLAVRS
ncbi:MAG: NAD-dependent epimerase/dehydratase family protein, partial [Gammaproteobacteria bacterium]|nr:NAD-dependent epimerase/dehydratase family protein [Gammaproteobacteria bacterium]